MTKITLTIAAALLLLPLATAPAFASPEGKTASKGLIRLATTGDPRPLQRELGGKLASTDKIAGRVKDLLQSGEHLAPKYLITPNGDIYAMVAPTITKDHFIFIRGDSVTRFDVGFTEKTNKPFPVKDIMEDGGASIFEQLGHWWDNL